MSPMTTDDFPTYPLVIDEQAWMTIVVRPMRSGKTQALLDWLYREPNPAKRIIVCATEQQCDELRHRAEEQKGLQVIPKSCFVSVENARYRLRGLRNAPKVAVDNADLVLTNLLGQTPSIYTFTEPKRPAWADWPMSVVAEAEKPCCDRVHTPEQDHWFEDVS